MAGNASRASRQSILLELWLYIDPLVQKAANSVEREENYVPRTRSDYGLPPENACQPLDYQEIFEDTPLFTLGRMLFMQLLGWQSYLLQNTLGSPVYPPGANVSLNRAQGSDENSRMI